jgi:hypothetical protein
MHMLSRSDGSAGNADYLSVTPNGLTRGDRRESDFMPGRDKILASAIFQWRARFKIAAGNGDLVLRVEAEIIGIRHEESNVDLKPPAVKYSAIRADGRPVRR